MARFLAALLAALSLLAAPTRASVSGALQQLQSLAGDGAPVVAVPRALYSKAQIAAWVAEEVRAAGLPMQVELLETSGWSDYVNSRHFVPPTADGLPAGHRFDFRGPPRGGLPNAEVDETGRLLIWRDDCDFFQYTEIRCRAEIHESVTHEARHFVQWQALARQGSLDRWSDPAHYQCREVEVFTAQIQAGELVGGPTPFFLRQLAFYAQACRGSRWKGDFAVPLKDTEAALARRP